MSNPYTKPIVVIGLLLLAGCTVTGDYSCGIPQNGVSCQPMSTTAAQLDDGSLASLHNDPFPVDEGPISDQGASTSVSDLDNDTGDGDSDASYLASDRRIEPMAPSPVPSIVSVRGATAILSAPREMRIWFDRFTDPEGDLHDESFVFIRIDDGHWVIDDKPVLY